MTRIVGLLERMGFVPGRHCHRCHWPLRGAWGARYCVNCLWDELEDPTSISNLYNNPSSKKETNHVP